MPTYDDLRRAWIATLSLTGELELLSAEQRRQLERGSLAVLGVSRGRELRRGRTLLVGSFGVSLAALSAGAACWVATSSAVEPAAAVAATAALALGAALLHASLVRRIARKRELYSALTATALAYSAE